jgi:hypothetical protein
MTPTLSAEAVFTSALQPSDHPTAEQVAAAVRDSLLRHGGQDGCASACAVEYGDRPETARDRMRWAIGLTERTTGSTHVAA